MRKFCRRRALSVSGRVGEIDRQTPGRQKRTFARRPFWTYGGCRPASSNRVPAPNPKQGEPMVDQNRHPISVRPVTARGRRSRLLLAPLAALAGTLMSFAVLAGAASAHGRRCAYAHTSIAAASHRQMRRAVLCLVNKERTARHLPRLRRQRPAGPLGPGLDERDDRPSRLSPMAPTSPRASRRSVSTGPTWARTSPPGSRRPRRSCGPGCGAPATARTSSARCTAWSAPGSPAVPRTARTRAPGPRTSGCGWASTPPSGNYGPAEGCPYRRLTARRRTADQPAATRAALSKGAVSRRYHSASSAAWQPDPAAVIAWR